MRDSNFLSSSTLSGIPYIRDASPFIIFLKKSLLNIQVTCSFAILTTNFSSESPCT